MGNFLKDDGTPNGYDGGYAVTGSTSFSNSQNYLTDVGAYTQSDSFYGTFDQGGNVWEWNDTMITGSSRGLLGSSWDGFDVFLESSYRYASDPPFEVNNVGFRVGTVPEPTVVGMLTLGMFLLPLRRKRPFDSNFSTLCLPD